MRKELRYYVLKVWSNANTVPVILLVGPVEDPGTTADLAQ